MGERWEERRYADHIFIQIYFRMHHFAVKFSKLFFVSQGGIDPPNQNPADTLGLFLLLLLLLFIIIIIKGIYIGKFARATNAFYLSGTGLPRLCWKRPLNGCSSNSSGQCCIAKNGGGNTQRGMAKVLKVPCLFMITEVSIKSKKVKVFPYSLPSVGPGADPGVQAVSPQVT